MPATLVKEKPRLTVWSAEALFVPGRLGDEGADLLKESGVEPTVNFDGRMAGQAGQMHRIEARIGRLGGGLGAGRVNDLVAGVAHVGGDDVVPRHRRTKAGVASESPDASHDPGTGGDA